MFLAVFLITGVAVVTGAPQSVQSVVGNQEFKCPDAFGVFEDPDQCDKYWECEEGIGRSRLCDDGLVFDFVKANAHHPDPCESPYVVDCGKRLELQNPSFTSNQCPRRNGIFADPDSTVCNRYYTCIEGHGTVTECAPGLHFDETQGICNWPEVAGRTGCIENQDNCIGNFCCNGVTVLTSQGVKLPHPTYANPADCQKFYVCLEGKTPQEGSCDLGKVYNEFSYMCDEPQNVQACTDWYLGNPLFDVVYDDADGDGLIDFGDRRDFTQTSIN